jgi:hypothetical protein
VARDSRGQVGRRLWRRRKRRGGDAPSPTDPTAPAPPAPTTAQLLHHDDDDDNDGDDGDDVPEYPGLLPPASPRGTVADTRGFFARLFGRKPPPPPPPPPVDPIASILAIPRGAARLDAFEARLAALAPGSPEHRAVAVAFHKELVALATEAGVDLALFEARVQACANGLVAAGEDEKAGSLLSRIGRRHQAAELFVKAGAIDALEEAHAELAFAEGGPRFEARLAFERFEGLFLVGRRSEALEALTMAVKLWDNPVYVEVREGFLARLPSSRSVTLQAGGDTVRVTNHFPLVLGRGEESAVRIDSPLVSRAHVDIQRRAGALVLKDLVSSGGTLLDNAPLAGPTPLSPRGAIDLAGVIIDYELDDARLLLRPRLRPRDITIAARSDRVVDPVVGCGLRFVDERVQVVADGAVRLNNDVVRQDTLVLIGDRLTVGARTWLVTA